MVNLNVVFSEGYDVFAKINHFQCHCQRKQAMGKDWGRLISLISSAFETYQVRLRLVVF